MIRCFVNFILVIFGELSSIDKFNRVILLLSLYLTKQSTESHLLLIEHYYELHLSDE